MKYCSKCNAENADTSKFCTECGESLAMNETFATEAVFDTSAAFNELPKDIPEHTDEFDTPSAEIVSYGSAEQSDSPKDKYTYTYNADDNHTETAASNTGISPRNIVVAIILSFVTCGIYQIYWMIKMTDEVNDLSCEIDAASGVLCFVFTLITCGIYGFYWAYKMGEKCDSIKGNAGGSSHILYLILAILGLGIVNYCLIQDTINKAV